MAFTITSVLHYRACVEQQAKFLAQIGDVTTPPEPAAETFDDVRARRAFLFTLLRFPPLGPVLISHPG